MYIVWSSISEEQLTITLLCVEIIDIPLSEDISSTSVVVSSDSSSFGSPRFKKKRPSQSPISRPSTVQVSPADRL